VFSETRGKIKAADSIAFQASFQTARDGRSVYGWFTEGFDTADLKEAKARQCQTLMSPVKHCARDLSFPRGFSWNWLGDGSCSSEGGT